MSDAMEYDPELDGVVDEEEHSHMRSMFWPYPLPESCSALLRETSDGSSADYYKLPTDSTQLQNLISYRNMNGQIAEIFRACYRYGLVAHSPKIRDAKKIKFYIDAEIERLEKYGE